MAMPGCFRHITKSLSNDLSVTEYTVGEDLLTDDVETFQREGVVTDVYVRVCKKPGIHMIKYLFSFLSKA